jgi:Uma2 family endonuclease
MVSWLGRVYRSHPTLGLRTEAMMNVIATLEPSTAVVGPAREVPLYEIVNGQKVELPPISIYAAWLASRLQIRIGSFAETHGLGTVVTEALFILDPEKDLRRRPDVAFVSGAKWPLDRPLPETGDWQMVPDLAVEVVSPTDVFQDVLAKMREYFRHSVKQVWIVLPVDREIYVYDSPKDLRVLTAADELDGSSLLPGLRLPVGSLFQRQPQTVSPEPPATP